MIGADFVIEAKLCVDSVEKECGYTSGSDGFLSGAWN